MFILCRMIFQLAFARRAQLHTQEIVHIKQSTFSLIIISGVRVSIWLFTIFVSF